MFVVVASYVDGAWDCRKRDFPDRINAGDAVTLVEGDDSEIGAESIYGNVVGVGWLSFMFNGKSSIYQYALLQRYGETMPDLNSMDVNSTLTDAVFKAISS